MFTVIFNVKILMFTAIFNVNFLMFTIQSVKLSIVIDYSATVFYYGDPQERVLNLSGPYFT